MKIHPSKMQKSWIIGTGFSRGIGFELAKQIKARGYKILHIGRKPCGFEDEFLICDLSNPPSTECLKSLNSKLSNKNIFGVFYSAGFSPLLTYEVDSSEQKMKFWESQATAMQVNYLSCACLVEEILPFLLNSTKENRQSHETAHSPRPFVAHFSSLAAVDPLPGLEFYGITKMAALKYFENLAKRFDANQLTCLSLHPGTVHTEMVEGIMNSEEHQHLPIVEIFKNAVQQNQMISAEQSAFLVADFLFNEDFAVKRKAAHGELYLADQKF